MPIAQQYNYSTESYLFKILESARIYSLHDRLFSLQRNNLYLFYLLEIRTKSAIINTITINQNTQSIELHPKNNDKNRSKM